MAGWADFEAAAPDLAAEARHFLEAGRHLTLATIRPDGAPRISGTEVQLRDGAMWFGSMWRSPKALDLQRDPRFALHSASTEPPDWVGDAKVSGRVVEIHDPDEKSRAIAAAGGAPPGPFHLFRAEIEEVVVIVLGDPADHLVARRWTPGGGLRRLELR